MRSMKVIFVTAAIFLAQSVFAEDGQNILADTNSSKPCTVIAKACSAAGFTRAEAQTKRFWEDCMKPIILGQTVQGVSVDAAVVQLCRTNKITQLKNELNELEKTH